jgi:hypothetical protein
MEELMTRFQKPVLVMLAIALFVAPVHAASLTDSLKPGKVELLSAGSLAFGPEGILFIGDSTAGAIYAIDTADRAVSQATRVDIRNLATKVAALLGTVANQIRINDLAVNPISRKTYLSISRGRGAGSTPVILRVDPDANFEVVSLDSVNHSKAIIPDSGEAGGTRRIQVITDIAFIDNEVYVAGLSNEEFSSNMRRIPFPFAQMDKGTNLEIWHGNHGGYETNSPVRTFASYRSNNVDYILAAYTCTPLVIIPVSDLKPGARVSGATIAELGNGNSPLDIVVYSKEGKNYVLLANSRRGVMKIEADNLTEIPSLQDREDDDAQLNYDRIFYMQNIAHLDTFDSERAIMLEEAGPSLNLKTIAFP